MKKAVVIVSFTDVRREPKKSSGEPHDLLQESQLLFGERVEVVEEKGEWCKIEALEQKKFLGDDWVGYPGWVETRDLIFVDQFPETNVVVSALWADITTDEGPISVTAGTRLQMIQGRLLLPDGREGMIEPCSLSPKAFLDLGYERLGHPYFWGGRSAYHPKLPYTGCDCSGLVNLLYRCQGVDLPRDAHDQYLFCEKITVEDLKMGDLVFLFSEKDPNRIDHVMLYAGENLLLEATEKTKNVRLVPWGERTNGVSFVCGSI